MEPEDRQGRDRQLAVRDPAHWGHAGGPDIIPRRLKVRTCIAWLEEQGEDSPDHVWGTLWSVMKSRRSDPRSKILAAREFAQRLDPIPRPEPEASHTTVNAVQVNLIAPSGPGEGQEGASTVPASLSITLAGNGHQEVQNGH